MKINSFRYAIPSITLLLFACVISLTFTGCNQDNPASARGKGPGGKSAMMFPVETITVQNRSVTYSIYAVGSVEAFELVLVTARVAGVVDKFNFSEGTLVRPDQVLVEIEPQRYKLTVESARAAWEKAKAAKTDAEAGLQRRQQVVEKNPGLIPGEELETWRTRVRTAIAEVALTQAQLNQAELNLHDALVRAPVAGLVQTRSVQTGQYVQPGTILATMIRRDPLLLRFKAPEQDAGRLKPGQEITFQVKNDRNQYTATITHVAASADDNTRMTPVTAEIYDRNKNLLRPGMFAEIHIPVGGAKESPVIPQTAVRPSERGFLSYIVENGKAVERVLTLGLRTSDGFVEVREGLTAGETLVIRGSEALENGVAVKINNPGPPPPGKTGKKQGAGA